ncbi:MAG: lysine biosynthesis protein LysW [Candidatus Magasanikbacteria bacterium CG11_big_fil_rev_8_21_14_0_20_39_34]|uniref:Lysine biosynthesis protein LysW n=1 Tax=Candidatus Magasanikbacteria bacterium CG11_big_fil_rev_8_21_14_0_20_39_34 TaxID=1974653 RepID=A0A2H0N522_9BACT|nr:MAG: lysine biosynthesis protein LysW [Candidatus Magasanikbacteria bacterium CG11_big_fil_rev_8_21_14_0_20_39_34]
MKCICVECKNEVDLSDYTHIKEGQIIECNTCGITLCVLATNDGVVDVEVADEGK